jgi:hypothetical protein
MSTSENVQVMLEIFGAIERRDPQRVFELCQPDVEFHWPPSLPYGGASPPRGRRRGSLCSRPRRSAEWILASSRPARRRLSCSGSSGESAPTGNDSTVR